MNNIKSLLFTLFFIGGCFSLSMSQSIILRQTNENGIYKSGEKARISLFLNDKSTDSVTLKIQKNFGKQTLKQLMYSGDTLVIFDEVLNEPATIIFEVKSKSESGSIGLIVDSEKFKPSTERPKDFEEFWKNEKKALRKLPMTVTKVPIKNIEAGYQCFDVELNCTGPKPARGYFAKPASSQRKSLPIVIYFHAAGVNGDWCRSEPGNAMRYAKMGKGVLGFDLNAHGMLNGQPIDYYNHLDSFELKGYAQTGLENKKDIYFHGM